jgi:hypothetical protein
MLIKENTVLLNLGIMIELDSLYKNVSDTFPSSLSKNIKKYFFLCILLEDAELRTFFCWPTELGKYLLILSGGVLFRRPIISPRNHKK